MRHRHHGAMALVTTIVLGACERGHDRAKGDHAQGPTHRDDSMQIDRVAGVTLSSAPGGAVLGRAVFVEQGGEVHVYATVDGLTPGKHGFHVHEHGTCTAPDFESAGGHFAGDHAAHGGPADDEHHGGDFGNLVADEQGRATLHLVTSDITLAAGSERSVAGRGMIVHAAEDDLQTQPSGNAGARLACGVIEVIEPSAAS